MANGKRQEAARFSSLFCYKRIALSSIVVEVVEVFFE